jgi:signal transduction histidine kinase
MSAARLPEYPDAILRGIWDMAFLISRDGTYLDYHSHDQHQLYAPPEAFIGRRVREIMPAALADSFMTAIERTCAASETVVVEYELPLPEETRFYQASIVDAGRDRVLSIVRDVTESRRARELTYSLAGRVIANQEAERARIARELHDNIGQRLASLNMEIGQLVRHAASRRVRSNLQAVAQLAETIAAEVGQLSRELHPPTLEALGLVSSLKGLCADMSRQAGIEISIVHRGVPEPLDWRISVSLYRIAQEALHNVVRHSRARHASVHLLGDAHALALYIADSGNGFDADARQAGIGLASMRERVEFLNGALAVHTAKGAGTRISVRIPLDVANRLLPLRTDTASNSISDLLDGPQSGGGAAAEDCEAAPVRRAATASKS